MLAEMMDSNLESAIAQLSELDITYLDLKNHVFGGSIDDMDDARRGRLASLVNTTGTEIYCFSSTLGHQNVSKLGEAEFRRDMTRGIDNILRTLTYIRPRMIRLLSCSFDERDGWSDSNEYLEHRAPWVYSAYRDAIKQIHDGGVQVTIENEPNTIFSSADETAAFFERLGLGDDVGFTWDIQNMWQSGTYPTRDVYESLMPVINYVHLKGGRGAPDAPKTMTYRSPLEDASWPVIDIVAQVLTDGISPVICLNPSHGVAPNDYAFASLVGTQELAGAEARRDVAFLRKTFQELS